MNERKTWLEEEDRVLKLLVQDIKVIGWAKIGKVMAKQFHMPGRSGKQCRERYHNHLDTNIKHGPWAKQEQQLLVDFQNSFGNRWAEIARAMGGRSQNTVKNKYFSIVRRGVRVLNMAIRRQLKKYKQLEMSSVRQIVDAYDPTIPASNQTPYHLSCGEIKKRLLFYSLRDDSLPLATDDYADIKKLIDSIRMLKKRHIANNRLENSSHMSMKESGSRERQEKAEGTEELGTMKSEKDVRQENIKKSRQGDLVQEEKEERNQVNNCILGLNKISLQSFNLEPLPQQVEQQVQDKDLNVSQLVSPIMSKNFSNFSNISNMSLFSFRESENEVRAGQLLRKEGTLRSFELPEMEQYRSPFMMIDSPHFDQLRSSFNSYSNHFSHH